MLRTLKRHRKEEEGEKVYDLFLNRMITADALIQYIDKPKEETKETVINHAENLIAKWGGKNGA